MATKVLITGIRGLIGTHLKTACEALGYTVYGTTRADSIESTLNLLRQVSPSYIFHTAAELVDDSKMFCTNVSLTHAILHYCKTAKVSLKRLVVIGSSSEYGRKAEPMAEHMSLEPETIYEGTKAAATMLARSFSKTYDIPTLVIRPFTVYGPGEKVSKFIPSLLALPDKIRLSEGVHDYVYIGDFVCILLELVSSCKRMFDLVNIGTGKQTSNLEVVRTVERLTGHIFYMEPAQAKPYDSSSWVCNTEYLHRSYGLAASTSLEQGLKSTMRALSNGAHN
jgi:nucleoside-diphosphate-sugar epimerase